MKRVLFPLFCFAAFLMAQTNRGSINGTVKDSSGAIVPGATVVVTNAGTNEIRRLKTTSTGAFTVADLEPVTYNILVEAPGFKKEQVEGVKVDTASVAGVVVVLQTGSIETQITVSAETVMVNTESGTTSSTVTERQIQDIPLVNRSVLDLALSQPNVTGDAGSENPVIASVTTCPGGNLSVKLKRGSGELAVRNRPCAL